MERGPALRSLPVKIKFIAPTSFDGVNRSCVKFKHSKKAGGLRCAKFQEGKPYPVCVKLKGGGRSQNYIRKAGCSKNKAVKHSRRK